MIYPDLIRHAPQWGRLVRAFELDRLAHAYLFHGPPGSGKEGHAIELAALVTCNHPSSDGACGTCPSCLKMRTLQHPNLQVVIPLPRGKDLVKDDPPLKGLSNADLDDLQGQLAAKGRDPYVRIRVSRAQSILINSVRELRRTVHLKPAERGWRIILIFQAEKLCDPQPAAANALLKLLEEPPAATLFVLVTDRAHMLLDTIRSRCQGVYFPQLTVDEVGEYLREHRLVGELEARVLAQAAVGDLPHARDMANEGGNLRETLKGLTDALLSTEPMGWQKLVNNLALEYRHHGEMFTYKMHVLQLWLRDLMILKKTDGKGLFFAEELDGLQQHAERFPEARWDAATGSVERLLHLLGRNIQSSLALTNFIMDVREALEGKEPTSEGFVSGSLGMRA
ncbi:ATP-binding protein [Candidatus Neomarinimicrobiota bacterium]